MHPLLKIHISIGFQLKNKSINKFYSCVKCLYHLKNYFTRIVVLWLSYSSVLLACFPMAVYFWHVFLVSYETKHALKRKFLVFFLLLIHFEMVNLISASVNWKIKYWLPYSFVNTSMVKPVGGLSLTLLSTFYQIFGIKQDLLN